MSSSWSKAAELAIKFLDGERAVAVAEVAGPRLLGKTVKTQITNLRIDYILNH